MAKKSEAIKDLSTEQKIKNAARKVFTEKGYAATRTRDIAEAAGINLALLNYYFRSKQKLFEEVLMEKVTALFGHILPIALDDKTDLEQKLDAIVAQYIELLSEMPGLPIFVLSEITNGHFVINFPVAQILKESALIKQIREKNPAVDPFHFLLNILGMTIFPFMVRPVFEQSGVMDKKKFEKLVRERKKLIPHWNLLLMEE